MQIRAYAARVGAALKTGLEELAAKYELIADVRGRGLMIAVELHPESPTNQRMRSVAANKPIRLNRFGISIRTADGTRHAITGLHKPGQFGAAFDRDTKRLQVRL